MGLFRDLKEDKMKNIMNDNSPKIVVKREEPVVEEPVEEIVEDTEYPELDTVLDNAPVKEEKPTDELLAKERLSEPVILNEVSVITASTKLTGDLTSAGSLEIHGTITGSVSCNGKLVITGTINGNCFASEMFADVAKIEGELESTGTVKIGAGSVIVGNIHAASAVVAGAVKGDIDVQGPVIIDTSAVIVGNIKSRSVQINNGAIIQGFCSQCYAEVDVDEVFGA